MTVLCPACRFPAARLIPFPGLPDPLCGACISNLPRVLTERILRAEPLPPGVTWPPHRAHLGLPFSHQIGLDPSALSPIRRGPGRPRKIPLFHVEQSPTPPPSKILVWQRPPKA